MFIINQVSYVYLCFGCTKEEHKPGPGFHKVAKIGQNGNIGIRDFRMRNQIKVFHSEYQSLDLSHLNLKYI